MGNSSYISLMSVDVPFTQHVLQKSNRLAALLLETGESEFYQHALKGKV